MKTYLNTVDGAAVGADKTFDSINPATGEVLGRAPVSTRAQVADAIAAARRAQPSWAARPDAERKALMMRVAEVIKANAAALAEWVTREQGKPLGGVGPDQVPGARFEAWGCEVWTQVPASLDLPVEVAFEDYTRRDEIHRNVDHTQTALDMLSMAQRFERIADISTNVAEDLIFLVEGRIVRHKAE